MRAAVAAVLLLATAAAAEEVRIAVEPDFPPFIALDGAGKLTGFDKAVGDEICARAALTCSWVVTDFEALIPGVAAGQFDMAMSGLGDSPERRQVVDFTDIYLPSSNPGAFVGKPGAPPPQTARIGVETGTIHEEFMRARGADYAAFGSVEEALEAATAGRIDLVFGSSSYFQSVLPSGYPSLRVLGLTDVGVEGTAIAVAKGRDDLRQTLNATIADMRRDGTIAALAEVWFAPQSDL